MSDNTQRESAALEASEASENPDVPAEGGDTSKEEAAEGTAAAVDEPGEESAEEPGDEPAEGAAREPATDSVAESVGESADQPGTESAPEPDNRSLSEPLTDSTTGSAEEATAEQGGVPMAAQQGQSQEQETAVQATKSARKAHLTVSRVEPWSVMKFSFVIALVCFIILFVAVAVIYAILSTLGVFDAVTDLITSLTEGGEEEDVILNPESWFSPARVLGYTGLIGALNIILITALSTVSAMLYNLAAELVGGVDVTLTESE